MTILVKALGREKDKIKGCRWCNMTPQYFYMSQGYKWGGVECDCGARGPDTRTGYDESEGAEWHLEAIREWNRGIE